MADDSLWGTIAGFLGGGGEATPREREMVMSPPPPKPELVQQGNEDSTAFRIRQRQAQRAWENEMREREDFPQDFMVPAAQAAPETSEESRYNRRDTIDAAVREAGG